VLLLPFLSKVLQLEISTTTTTTTTLQLEKKKKKDHARFMEQVQIWFCLLPTIFMHPNSQKFQSALDCVNLSLFLRSIARDNNA
jgi:hypothetical protein